MSRARGSKIDVPEPSLPLPIFRLSASRPRYMLYDVNTVSWLRQEHHILGVQIGGMPQFPQQNVFSGLPLELMPEEAKLLVADGVAYVVDDLEAHLQLAADLAEGSSRGIQAKAAYEAEVDVLGMHAEEAAAMARRESAEKAARRRPVPSRAPEPAKAVEADRADPTGVAEPAPDSESDTLFGGVTEEKPVKAANNDRANRWTATPTTSSSLIRTSPSRQSGSSPIEAPAASYAVFRHLHERGYFMSPGLRFGCQLMAYPGDPLRYHSHFLCTGAGWDEEVDLLDLVGGGRLGTGVKKGFLLGGKQPDGDAKGGVRTFCIEWGGI